MVLIILNVNYYIFFLGSHYLFAHENNNHRGEPSLILDLCIRLLIVLNWALEEKSLDSSI